MCTSPFCVCTISVHLLTKYISKRGSYKWTVHEVFVIACVCIFVLHFCRTRNKIHKESKRMITGQFNAMVVFVLCSCWLCVWVCCPQISVGITARAQALLCLSFVFVTSGLFCVCKTTRSKTHKESSWNNCRGAGSFVFVTSGLFCVCKTTINKTHKESSLNNCTGCQVAVFVICLCSSCLLIFKYWWRVCVCKTT